MEGIPKTTKNSKICNGYELTPTALTAADYNGHDISIPLIGIQLFI